MPPKPPKTSTSEEKTTQTGKKEFYHKNYYAKPFEKERRCYLFPKTISNTLNRSVSLAMEKRGFGKHDLIRDWPKIAGAQLSAYTTPVRLHHAKGSSGGVLYIRTTSAHALDLQYQEPIILEKLSLYYGYPIAKKITILHK